LKYIIERFGPASNTLLAAARANDEFSIRVLAPALAGVRVLDATRTFATALALTAPEESPVVRVLGQFGRSRGGASVCLAGSVGSTVVAVVLVVDLEDGEGLGLVGASVVAALCRLDRFAGL
jgi:hypothetical protein